jgi:hypothetical protein
MVMTQIFNHRLEKKRGRRCGFLHGVGTGRDRPRSTTFVILGYNQEETYSKAKVKEVEAMQHLYM